MTSCQFCDEPVVGGAAAHWMCGGILPDDPRERPIAVADHIVECWSAATARAAR